MKRRIITVLLTLATLLVVTCMMPACFADETSGDYQYTITDGSATITGCNNAISGEVNIPATLGGYPVTVIGERAFQSCKSITAVTIPDSVITIAYQAFEACSGLRSVVIGSNVTKIQSRAFNGCAGMTSLSLNEKIAKMGSYAFSGCLGLTNLELPDSVTEIGEYAFADCSGLIRVTLGTGLTSIQKCLFSNCNRLQTFEMSNSVTSIGGYAFYHCASLKSIPFSTSLAYIGNLAFSGCKSLEALDFPDSMTTVAACAFERCSGLRSVVFKKAHTEISNYAFDSCTALTTLQLGENLVSIGDNAFQNCDGLSSVTIPDSVTEIGEYAFAKCGGLEEITIGNGVGVINRYTFNNCKRLTSVNLGNGITSIHSYAFNYCTNLGSISIPSSTTTIEVVAFYQCNNLTCAHFLGAAPYLENRSFESCTTLRYLEGQALWTESEISGNPTSVWEHTYSEAPATSCSAPGTQTYTCSVCGAVTVVETPALPHTEVIDAAVAPTCTEPGLSEGKHCSVCNTVISEPIPLDALGHAWNGGIITKEATLFEDGEMTYTCTRCTASKTEVIPKLEICNGGADCPSAAFLDMPVPSNWAHAGIDFCVSHGLFAGTSTTTFSPAGKMTRAMLVTVLWRLDGELKPTGSNSFTDVKAGQWYTTPVIWAAENEIVTGVGNSKFNPNGNVTREQIAAIMYRYANYKKYDTAARADLSKYPDVGKASGWATEALAWANAEGLINGTAKNGKDYLDPQGNATRAQVAAILMRYVENVAK